MNKIVCLFDRVLLYFHNTVYDLVYPLTSETIEIILVNNDVKYIKQTQET